MKPVLTKTLFALCISISMAAGAQRGKSVDQIRYDPDWQIILGHNKDFLNRMLQQEQPLSALWARGQDHMLQTLGFSLEEYTQKHAEIKDAANRLLQKYPQLNAVGCDNCRPNEMQMLNATDNVISNLKRRNLHESSMFFREIDDEEGEGPKCGLRFYACIAICAATIEFFPVYLACCTICLCQHCQNPPKWCN